jgi:predicted aminopeptidase
MLRILAEHPAKVLLTVVLSTLLISCDTLSYYSQAVGGQLNLLRSRQSLQALIDDNETSPELREKLQQVLSIREFAELELALPLNGNFATYVDLERPYVVWNVFATPQFSMSPLTWCYPVAGCVSYRGYFDENSARAYAAELEQKGFDVYVGGVAAYSTLGWFADPLLNTVIGRDSPDLASLIFHELSHQQVYVKGDTDFNESFATAVEREGLRRWLQHSYSSQEGAEILQQTMLDFDRQEDFVALIQSSVKSLNKLYASEIDEEAMAKGKADNITALRESYAQLKQQWGGYAAYDGWFSASLNNAQLGTVATYYRWVDAFENLLEQTRGDLPAFYEAVDRLGSLDSSQRMQELEAFGQALSPEAL